MECLFCGLPEKGYPSDPDKEFICSRCVQILLSADQEDLNRAYRKAIEKGYPNKARAIESFLMPEEINARETKVTKRNLVRKRPMQSVRPSRNQLRT
jgi:hypothetical protein